MGCGGRGQLYSEALFWISSDLWVRHLPAYFVRQLPVDFELRDSSESESEIASKGYNFLSFTIYTKEKQISVCYTFSKRNGFRFWINPDLLY